MSGLWSECEGIDLDRIRHGKIRVLDSSPDEIEYFLRRDAYLWPHFNLEDLEYATDLPNFLISHGKMRPDQFVDIDLESISVGYKSSATVPAKAPRYYVTLSGHSQTRYATTLPWQIGITPNDGYSVGEIIFILEVQERLLGFLLICTCALLEYYTWHEMLENAEVFVSRVEGISRTLSWQEPDKKKDKNKVSSSANVSSGLAHDFSSMELHSKPKQPENQFLAAMKAEKVKTQLAQPSTLQQDSEQPAQSPESVRPLFRVDEHAGLQLFMDRKLLAQCHQHCNRCENKLNSSIRSNQSS
ncbi:hypothetical protein BJ878DRAFT_558507 [Calycina marina]|uniref:Uncharacterized protein n=1 Tax=Calycina marina TaxID=1763456 RepID=A0A9P7YWZ2_9HELO|nr:hypothetical protein BJ878DRAFT_558507 [Calycina marina]